MADGPAAFDEEMAEILESFIVETREILERLGQDLLTLEKGTADQEMLNTIFRAVHTVKGTSSFLGLDQMTGLAHRFEDVLNKVRKGELTVTPPRMDVMLEAYDLLRVLLENIEARKNVHLDLDEILGKLKAAADPAFGAAASPAPAAAAPAAPAPASAAPQKADAPPARVKAPLASGAAPAAPSAAPAVTKAPAASPEAQPEPRVPESQPESAAAKAGPDPKSADTTIRVDVARLDALMNLVGELVLGRNRLAQIAFDLGQENEGMALARELSATSAQIDFVTTELQMAVMKTRMIPVAKVFNRLPRLVRDLMKETGKQVDLQVSGEETELDKTIIEELTDPLIHILRNAVDHGIETPDVREKAGKPPLGTVKVSAEHEGNHIVIRIEDDGKGMDPEKLKAKAVEKALITEAQAREMTVAEAYNLVFIPGFSMAANVTNISGRGVGMDVVRTNIGRLKGIIEITSALGQGSVFTIKLPLTLAIIQALLVQSGKETFSLPLGSVLEVVRVKASDIGTIHGREVIRLRDSVLPIARLERVLNVATGGGGGDWIYVVVVGVAEKKLGIIVDGLTGQKEVVIKSMGAYLHEVHGIAGSTILGDGRVIMILDIGEFMNLFASMN
ncbi:MAG TPA: chemotaxis protein CheA [Bacteroidota bacterium]|nr:chemotaxis protein CheA [Bacteroidota bacterium]